MKPFHYLVLALVVAGALAGSALLIPGDTDLGLMFFRGRHFDEARPLLEKRFAAGDRSVDVVMPLAEVYVQDGRVDLAVQLLRQVRTTNADQLALFQKVAVFQKYNEQMQDYLRTLETIQRIAGSEDGLRELANQYRYANDNARLLPALQTLVARYKAEPEEYQELANLLAAGSKFTEAATVLQRFEVRRPKDISAESTELYISILLDGGNAAPALDRARRWLGVHHESETVVRFAALLRTRGSAELGAKLLAPFDAQVDEDPLLLAEWLEERVAENKTAEAFSRLERLRRSKPLSEGLIRPYISLALQQGELTLAVEAAERYGVIRLDDAVLREIVDAAFSAGQGVVASRIALAAGPAFVDNHPLLAAHLAFAQGDWAGAVRHVRAAESRPGLSQVDHFEIAKLDAILGRQLEALAQLAQIDLRIANDDLLLETARLYNTIGHPSEGVRQFDRLRAGRTTFAGAQAWAMVAAADGRADKVVAWLRSTPSRIVPEARLRDLAYTANDIRKPGLALAIAERLYTEHPADATRMMLARALNSAGQPAAALPHLRALLKSAEPEAEEIYTAALLGAIRATTGTEAADLRTEIRDFWTKKLGGTQLDDDKQVEILAGLLDAGAQEEVLPRLAVLAHRREELVPLYVETAIKAGNKKAAVEFLKSELARSDLRPDAREARVYALIDHAGQEEALPYMRELAGTRANWDVAYEEALEKLGKRNELLEFWRVKLANGAVPPDQRRGVAWKLIDQGRPEWARSIFAELANNAPPESPDVTEWLYLCGGSPGREVLETLEARARNARANERVSWLTRLLEAGGADRVIAVVSAEPPTSGAGGELFDVYVHALAARNDIASIASVITKESAAVSDPERVRQLATMARETGGLESAGAAYGRLAELRPGDREATHWLGVLDFTQAHYSTAERRLESLLASSPGSYDDNYYLAEMLWRAGKRSQARNYYSRAVRLIEQLPSPPVEARAAHAQAMFHAGFMQQALREYRILISEQPRNGDLRADFGGMLLEAAKYNEADDVLTSGVDSGGTRMAMLRAQLLSSTGRLPEAMALIQRLTAADGQLGPPSASLLAVLGNMEQSAGRNLLAQDLIRRAAGLAPQNEDLTSALDAIERARAGQWRVESESRNISGVESDQILRASGVSVLSRAVRMLFSMEQDQVSMSNLQRQDGTRGGFNGMLRRAEAALEWEAMNGTRVKAELFTSGSEAGGGIAVTRPDLRGTTSASIEAGRPSWDLPQLLVQGGTRDRVEVKRDASLGPRVALQASAGANRYNLPGLADAAESITATGNISMTLLRNPQIALSYSLDAEYLAGSKSLRAQDGTSYRPVALVSREVHTASVQAEKQLARGLHANGAAGVSVDRMGGAAPYFSGGLTWDRLRHFGAHVDYDHRLNRYGGNQTATSLRGGIFWIF